MDLYQQKIADIFARNRLTNSGPYEKALTEALQKYLGVEYLLLVANGTVALQVAYQVFGVKKAITTPFTFAATPGSLSSQNIETRFADICPKTFNLDPQTISNKELQWADALVPVHVFGNPCKVDQIDALAKKHQLKVIYDAAHCFASKYRNKSLLNFGDCATLSLHATKLFHTVEGGAIIFKRKSDYENAKKIINFGLNIEQIPEFIGTNAKMSEMHAAMGLCVFEHIDYITAHRSGLFNRYQSLLYKDVGFQHWPEHTVSNGAYMPILLKNELELLYLSKWLEKFDIQTRRYFYPSLDSLGLYSSKVESSVSQSVSNRVLCLPMYSDLSYDDVDYICGRVLDGLNDYRQNT
ncbi:DegT/DnrJ/EryC1/StrS family aminotransferase [Pseudoalteromonas sp. T1lg65]|uniref:DegT/DnrJ/EryC1/StrS family aminotransferase n=1 Tax=Pseudoalteromonas sp. T1lg65 TaxID=2077101 RepID=UPI003F7A6982